MVGFGLCHYDFSVREVVLPERDRVGVPAPAVDCATSPASAIATCDAEKARRLLNSAIGFTFGPRAPEEPSAEQSERERRADKDGRAMARQPPDVGGSRHH